MSVKVAVRVRPFNNRERQLNCKLCVDMQGTSTIVEDEEGKPRTFTFDYSFWSHDEFIEQPGGYLKPAGDKYADQQIVYEAVGQEVLRNAWDGYHCCLFAYGQTGSGKSYSMIGYGANKGIVPISSEEIFNRIARSTDPNITFEVTVSMIEIYNEKIQDLLIDPSDRVKGGLKVRESKTLGVYVEGLTNHRVRSYEEIAAKMDEGSGNRSIGATEMNAHSSRAHTVITINFMQKVLQNGRTTDKISVINLVDLAGSEKASKTGASGDRLKEGCAINKSLTILGIVISTLAEKSGGKAKGKVVPYRDSALTRILQNALGGNSKTLMICAISPASNNYEETISTLRYAPRDQIRRPGEENQVQRDHQRERDRQDDPRAQRRERPLQADPHEVRERGRHPKRPRPEPVPRRVCGPEEGRRRRRRGAGGRRRAQGEEQLAVDRGQQPVCERGFGEQQRPGAADAQAHGEGRAAEGADDGHGGVREDLQGDRSGLAEADRPAGPARKIRRELPAHLEHQRRPHAHGQGGALLQGQAGHHGRPEEQAQQSGHPPQRPGHPRRARAARVRGRRRRQRRRVPAARLARSEDRPVPQRRARRRPRKTLPPGPDYFRHCHNLPVQGLPERGLQADRHGGERHRPGVLPDRDVAEDAAGRRAGQERGRRPAAGEQAGGDRAAAEGAGGGDKPVQDAAGDRGVRAGAHRGSRGSPRKR